MWLEDYLAINLTNYHYGKRLLCRVSNTRQSSKNTRQSLCRVLHSAKDTRKRKCRQRGLYRVHFVRHSAKPLPSAKSCTRQNLSAVTEQVHNGRFAECQDTGTWQRLILCRVPESWHSANITSLPSVCTRQRFFKFCRVQTLSKDSSDFAECKHSAKCPELPILICFFYFIHTYISEKHISLQRPPTSHLYHKHHIYITNTIDSHTYPKWVHKHIIITDHKYACLTI
jgi:hypothetical protein